jgi:hypothetical protein
MEGSGEEPLYRGLILFSKSLRTAGTLLYFAENSSIGLDLDNNEMKY